MFSTLANQNRPWFAFVKDFGEHRRFRSFDEEKRRVSGRRVLSISSSFKHTCTDYHDRYSDMFAARQTRSVELYGSRGMNLLHMNLLHMNVYMPPLGRQPNALGEKFGTRNGHCIDGVLLWYIGPKLQIYSVPL